MRLTTTDVTAWARHRIDIDGGAPDVTGLRRTAIELEPGVPYIERFHVIDSRSVSIRFHHWLSSDDGRAPHDHPWNNGTMLLAGSLLEHTAGAVHQLEPHAVITRAATDAHIIELQSPDAWTLFVTGPVIRPWGFHTAAGWVHWSDWPGAGRYV